ncbi:hypothetical protein ACOSQ2_009362 [Xanthoceras sorbifolium]
MASTLRKQKSSSSLASTSIHQYNYDVFLSFRFEDTRKNFTDHLYAALDQKGIYAYERHERGNEVSSSSECLEAIEESRFSIVILSKNYASSICCLDELARIVECMEMKNLTVLPVFYDVDPSEVRKQKGDFKKVFDEHEENYSKKKVQRWREALTQVANLSGWHLQGRHEAKLIKEIVDLTLRRLNRTISSVVGELVGIDSRVEEIIYEYLEPGLDDIRFVGIWGMGGIGKTTIARVVYTKLSDQYDGRCFLADVREEAGRRGAVYLQEMLLSKVLQETNLNICDDHEGINLIRKWLCHKRVFIVLDDVDDQLKQLEKLAGNRDWFGSGSRIIVTTRNKHVLISHGVNNIYKVEVLNHGEALELFRLKAFKYKQPSKDHDLKLTNSVINYAKGLPLALKVLGSFLCDQSANEWKVALNGLQKVINQEVLKLLRISYDGLEKIEKKIFLDIVCFFKGKDKDRVVKLLNSFYPDIGLEVLIEKSLLTISNNNVLMMHDLVQEMGWEIVREQHHNEPGKWSRLWLCKDVYHVLTQNMGTQAVEGIMLDMPKKEIIHLSGNSFSTMRNLRLLKISNILFSNELEYLSDELRYLKWHGYPLKSLPSSFQPKHLFKLDMCYSNIQYLWKGIKHFEELKTIKLKNSHNLIRTPDFTGLPNLERLDLEGCTRLLEVHPSIGFLKQLNVLNLKGCKNIVIFPSDVCGLKSLKILNLYGCTKLDKLPHDLEELECLEELDVGATAVQEVPSSIVKLTNLKKLSFSGCKGKPHKSLSSSLWSLLFPRRFLDCKGLILPPLAGLCSLKTLDLRNCNLLEGETLNDLGSLVSLEELNLSGNRFVSLPASVSQLSKLKILCLEKCQWLRSLPQLPPEIVFVGAEDCTSLETLSNALELSASHAIALHFFNCNKLVENQLGRKNSLAVVLLQRWLQEHPNPFQFHIRLPGSEIPEWFDRWSNACSAEINLSPNWLNDEFIGFAMCAVFAISDHSDEVEIHCAMTINTCLFKFSFAIPCFTTVESDHLWLAYLSRWMFESGSRDQISTSKHVRAHFRIIGRDKKECSSSVKSCGIRLVYKRNVEYHFEESSGSDSATTIADDQQNHDSCCDLEWMSFTEIHMPDILLRSSIRKPYSRMQQIFDDEQEDNRESNQVHDFNEGNSDADVNNEDSCPATKRRKTNN